jgi:hypothetical protein
VLNVVLQNDFARVVDGGTDSGQLNKYLAAILAVFDHFLDLFKMTDGARKTVDDRLRVLVSVRMRMLVAVFNYRAVFKNVPVNGVVFVLFHSDSAFVKDKNILQNNSGFVKKKITAGCPTVTD